MSDQDGIHTEPDAPEIEQQPEAVQFTEDAQGKAFVDNHDGNIRHIAGGIALAPHHRR